MASLLNFILHHTPILYLTQSVWRDEAFSILLSQKPLWETLPKLTFEPPLYYILLHFWIKIFGSSEIAVRSLSLLGFSLSILLVILWSEKRFRNHWLSWYVPLFFFLNPMLLYYAFEVRAYGWYIFFITASSFAYSEKRWKWYAISGILGFYTHVYMGILIGVQTLHHILTERHALMKMFRDPMIRALGIIGIFTIPWLIRIFFDLTKLRNSWYFPVDAQLVRSVLGNLFVGYEGTPGGYWGYTAILSILFLVLCLVAWRSPHHKNSTRYFILASTLSPLFVIGISLIKPLFVNRYVIFITVSEICVIAFALEQIKPSIVQKLLAGLLLCFVVFINLWYPSKHPKLPIRATINEIETLKQPTDLIFANSPLIFFETIYYSKNKNSVYLYNPSGSAFPWYVGDIIVSDSQMRDKLSRYPIRSFVVNEDGTYDVRYDL
ncbi:MAG: hypothetical protein Q7S76_04145 [bacterium]|nr:hypothetical protein [bacterium]